MSVSNLSTGLRPGVCLSTSRPTAPYEGQMIYETDTDLTYIYGGSAWQQVSGGTAVGNSGLVYVAGASFSGVTTGAPLDIDSVFSSRYINYVLILRVAQTVAQSSFYLRLRTTGGQEAGNVYNHTSAGYYTTSAGPYVSAGYSSTTPASPETYHFTGMVPSSGFGATAKIEIHNPQAAQATRFMGTSFTPVQGTYYNVSLNCMGSVENTTSYTGLRLFPFTGTSAGEYAIYGYRIT